MLESYREAAKKVIGKTRQQAADRRRNMQKKVNERKEAKFKMEITSQGLFV